MKRTLRPLTPFLNSIEEEGKHLESMVGKDGPIDRLPSVHAPFGV